MGTYRTMVSERFSSFCLQSQSSLFSLTLAYTRVDGTCIWYMELATWCSGTHSSPPFPIGGYVNNLFCFNKHTRKIKTSFLRFHYKEGIDTLFRCKNRERRSSREIPLPRAVINLYSFVRRVPSVFVSNFRQICVYPNSRTRRKSKWINGWRPDQVDFQFHEIW